MNVLSLFDGMSCGQIALDKLGIKVDNYFAAEIDKYAIQVTQKNFPNTIQIGSVTDLYYKEHGQLVWGKPQTDEQPRGYQDVDIDILYGGSPCQSLVEQVMVLDLMVQAHYSLNSLEYLKRLNLSISY